MNVIIYSKNGVSSKNLKKRGNYREKLDTDAGQLYGNSLHIKLVWTIPFYLCYRFL